MHAGEDGGDRIGSKRLSPGEDVGYAAMGAAGEKDRMGRASGSEGGGAGSGMGRAGRVIRDMGGDAAGDEHALLMGE